MVLNALNGSNGSLDFPPEILIKIFQESKWNLELRILNSYFSNVYNQYNDLKFTIRIDNCISEIAKDNKALVSFSFHIGFLKNTAVTLSELIQMKVEGEIDLRVNFINKSDIYALTEALKTNKSLTSLRLSNCIFNENVTLLTDALRENKTLRTLDLSDNYISISGCIVLAKFLQHNNTLTSLILRYNDFRLKSLTLGDADVFIKTLQCNNTLELVDLTRTGIEITINILSSIY